LLLEGVLRNDSLGVDGGLRDTLIFSRSARSIR
jgi:hypothetical protein